MNLTHHGKRSWKPIFPEFLAFFLPEAFDGIDWERGFTFLDKELSRITRDSQIGDSGWINL